MAKMDPNKPRGGSEGLSEQFVDSLRTLFDILDESGTGFIKYTDIESYWFENDESAMPAGILQSLRQITPKSGKLSFDRFMTGLKIALLKARTDNGGKREQANDVAQYDLSSQNSSAICSPKKSPTATVHPQRGYNHQIVPNIPVGFINATVTENSQVSVYRPEKTFVLQGIPLQKSGSLGRKRTQSDPTVLNSSDTLKEGGSEIPVRSVQSNLQTFFPTPASLKNPVHRPTIGEQPSTNYRPNGRHAMRSQTPNFDMTDNQNKILPQRSIVSEDPGYSWSKAIGPVDERLISPQDSSDLNNMKHSQSDSHLAGQTVYHNSRMYPTRPQIHSQSDSQLPKYDLLVQDNVSKSHQPCRVMQTNDKYLNQNLPHQEYYYNTHNGSDSLPRSSTHSAFKQNGGTNRTIREQRRHTLQNGVDFNFVKKMKELEKERDVLLQGLQVIEQARDWYRLQIQALQDRQRTLSQNPNLEIALSAANQQDRMTIQAVQIEDANRKLRSLIQNNVNNEFSPPHSHNRNEHLTERNMQLNQEISQQAERILQLEQDKVSLIKDLFEAKAKSMPLHGDTTFM